ncbi:MAG: hypothetical protein FD146_115 [Anaerolineaceae bacterium]|nr:MAG: hypothetical protein FD146_115 [Anaerolineaceae bacterium]
MNLYNSVINPFWKTTKFSFFDFNKFIFDIYNQIPAQYDKNLIAISVTMQLFR